MLQMGLYNHPMKTRGLIDDLRVFRIVSKSTSSHLHAISNHLLSARLPLCLVAQFTHRAVVGNSGDVC